MPAGGNLVLVNGDFGLLLVLSKIHLNGIIMNCKLFGHGILLLLLCAVKIFVSQSIPEKGS